MNDRLPRVLWRVVAIGGDRRYWEPSSMTYTREDFALAKAAQYRQQGATVVRIYRAEPLWEDVTDELIPNVTAAQPPQPERRAT